MNQPNSAYVHSGAVGASPLMVPVFGVLASLVFGLIYAYVSRYNPLAYFSVFAVFVYGLLVGKVVVIALKVFKCRNTRVAGVLALLLGLFALYSAWSFFLFVFLLDTTPVLWSDFPSFFVSPLAQWEMMVVINDIGWFEMFGTSPRGVVLWIMWAIEAVAIVGIVRYEGIGAISDEVFCETCSKWLEEDETAFLAAPEEMSDLERLSAGELKGLSELETVSVFDCPRLQVETKSCGKCENMFTYQIKAVMETQDKEGNPQESATELTSHMLISPAEHAGILKLAQRPIPDHLETDTEEASEEEDDAAGEQ